MMKLHSWRVAIVSLALASCGGQEGPVGDARPGDLTDVAEHPDAITEVAESVEDSTPVETTEVGQVDAQEPELPFTVTLACEAASDCKNPCGSAECIGGRCKVTPWPGKCFVAEQETGTCYAMGQGDCLVCNPDLAQDHLVPFALALGFDGPLTKVVVEDLSSGGIVWQVSTARAHGGSSSLYFGDPTKKNYSNGKRVSAAARLPPVQLPGGKAPALRFFLFLDTEETPGYDRFFVLGHAPGEADTELFSSDELGGSTQGRFLPVTVDLSAFAGRTVHLSLVFDSIDEGMNSFEGAYVDDLRVTTGCCEASSDCDDSDPCSDDQCEDGECKYSRRSGCCVFDQDCSDDDPCTKDQCPVPGGACEASLVPGCCHDAGDCDDNDDCTEDLCPGYGAQCVHRPLCCKVASDCNVNDPCLKASCEEGRCKYSDTCCHSDQECDDKDPCTIDGCDAGACVHYPASIPGCCFPTVWEEGFDSGPGGFELDPPVGGIGWTVVSSRTQSGAGALYYGDPALGIFNAGADNSGSAVSSTVLLPVGIDLVFSFWFWMDVEGDWWSTESDMAVYLVSEGQEYKLWSKGWSEPQKKWTQKQIDITAFGGREVYFRFDFSSTYYGGVWEDGSGSSAGEGVYVDSVEIHSSCSAKKCNNDSDCSSLDSCMTGVCMDGVCNYVPSCCASDDECDDGDLCTKDSCGSSKHCVFSKITNCCVYDSDCSDSNPCTVDKCPEPGGQCLHDQVLGCCQSSKDCDDGDVCTKDLCMANACSHEVICCETDADCDDGDSLCTVDMCVNKFCKHELTGAEGCCKPTVFEASFEDGDDGFMLDPPKNGVGWHLTDKGHASDGKWALYYGNPTTKNYDSGDTNSGDAVSPVVTIPKDTGAKLSFAVWMKTESSAEYDVLSMLWVEGEHEYELWRKGSDEKTSFEVEVNMSGFAGRTGSIVFRFDTVDYTVNDYEGVYVDSVMLTSTCAPVTCSKALDCDDKVGFTKDACVLGTCSYEIVDPECTSSDDCDDNDYCTDDLCVAGQCVHQESDWCW